ncbi:hypothetical protein Sjap_010242 [Stephania japonica]|uniref:Purple acid phosphatase n=1 Tax=Stephania japonica TaxID=461633 RepID=A0AAP0JA06_9MAGN
MAVLRGCLVALSLLIIIFQESVVLVCYGGITSTFVRQPEKTMDMPLNSDVFKVPHGYNAPQQLHITQGDHEGRAVIVSWVTPDEAGSSTVLYWKENTKYRFSAKGAVLRYKFYNYTSGYIHHCTVKNLEFDTKYYYLVGVGGTTRQFWFRTPPRVGPDVPYTFGLIGDLGQSYDSNRTLAHYETNPAKGQTVLFVGDLSYADNYSFHDNRRWDTWGRFVERSVAYQPWIWTAGNHEIDFLPENGETVPFKPFKRRYHVPYKASGSTAPFGTRSRELRRTSLYYHHILHMENTLLSLNGLKRSFQRLIGHVHAYERSERVSNIAYNIVNGICTPVKDQSAPVYITIGDGGNLEGLATNMTYPQPKYSAFREASFGHAIFDIKNRTHAYYSWHRNEDGVAIPADSLWFFNRHWYPENESTVFAS